jgi:hypothetical protein
MGFRCISKADPRISEQLMSCYMLTASCLSEFSENVMIRSGESFATVCHTIHDWR